MEKPFITILSKVPPAGFMKKVSFIAKNFLKKKLGRVRGPDAVLESLIRGLKEKNIPFNVDPKDEEISEVVHAISGVGSLKKALSLKSEGKIKTVFAGPNISILPIYDDKILLDPKIDAVFVPSEWVKEAYTEAAPVLEGKLHTWPAGVKLPEENTLSKSEDKDPILVFRKSVPEELFLHVQKTLEELALPFTVITYGSYSQKEYFELLRLSSSMIYLQEVESQGLALQLAWAFDVPTLVWNKGTFTYPNTSITVTGKVSAPYLDQKCGEMFTGESDFKDALLKFKEKLPAYTPRAYCKEFLSDSASIDQYMKIVNNVLHE